MMSTSRKAAQVKGPAQWWQALSPAEIALHKAIVGLLEVTKRPGVTYWHTPNGEKRDAATGAKLKAMGVLPGVADLIIMSRSGFRAMEIKSRDGNTSPEQNKFLDSFAEAGGQTAIVRSVDEAERIFKLWNITRISTVRR